MKNNIHIGSLIKKKFEEKMEKDKHFNKVVFAEQIIVHRATIYSIFKQETIDIGLLMRISKALDYDFIKEAYKAVYAEEKQEENKTIIEIEITKQQLQQLECSDNLLFSLKVNKE